MILPTTMFAVAVIAGCRQSVDAFSTVRRSVDHVGNTLQPRTAPVTLFGILDDLMEEENSCEEEEGKNDDDERLERLYHSLIFSGDVKSEISRRLEACTDPGFSEYLVASSKSTRDRDEQQGLEELIGLIEEVKTTAAMEAAAEKEAALAKAEKDKELRTEAEAQTAINASESKKLTNADLLKKANQIDAAIALSDDEKPSDFISDCREVVNLSRGFNDSGQMRVGGG
ncbi:unnamed protein product [Pseudo-nitzschia multistriata]|uniref:Uncharacterized protein n=1 Tax=Pseudo-nitzschia multistriata TaxID=183589 RepID=A0A448ZCK8_9STRA|nr:unnamed protein product [Pseudo-nitzschia multistriata]